MKPRCANEVPVNDRPPPSHVSPMSVCVMKASCRLQYSAPLGSPVVPEVKMIATARSGSSGSTGPASPEPRGLLAHRGRLGDGRVEIDVELGIALADQRRTDVLGLAVAFGQIPTTVRRGRPFGRRAKEAPLDEPEDRGVVVGLVVDEPTACEG